MKVGINFMQPPLISVIMGVYYRDHNIALLKRSVQSILEQSMVNLELLICDNGSVPEACTFLNAQAASDLRIRLIRKDNCFTLPAKLNLCLLQAKGTWVARMDDDDYAHPERLKCQLKYLQTHTKIAFVGCNVDLWCGGQIVGQRCFPEFPQVNDFYITQPFIHPALLFRRTALEAVGGYSEDRHCILCEDYDLLLRLYTKGLQGANLQEKLLEYTVPSTVKGNRRFSHRINECVTRFVRFKELGLLPSAYPYVMKPLIVGLLPAFVLKQLKGLSQ
ncbi:glycosyltransferase [Agathobaculum sp. NTUH-O15-33]|uniref:glycosyltransferase n=1 Tax=Agathobaculum sp. NTUH-O15-33 TaxID=3079302 RepID=UPI00295856A2|nr:glycosyltransferase [Agathobaculum sp. NTUH-O15-33]WNX83434.1 glycosyltransferase [Agathobaculum sp. NTUH-O15-33]